MPKNFIARRKPTENPFDPACKLAFRRICGVCKGFPVGAKLTAKDQHCSELQITVDGPNWAGDCNRWTRKMAG